MNVLFLTLLGFNTIYESGLYQDLLREFVKKGHQVYAISPVEKREKQYTHLFAEENVKILRLQIGNTQKTNILEKGISTIQIEPAFKKAVKTYFLDVKFDLVLYSTPPITLTAAVKYVKKRDEAKTYLLLKDIFPQNAVDIGLLSKNRLRGLLYNYFRKQEKKLYAVSDRIGCMSPANVKYILEHNPEVNPVKVEVCPNSIEVIDKSVDDVSRKKIRIKYGIPLDKAVFVYGGNLGKPQGIPFLIECLRKCREIENVFFLIVGDGTEYHLIEEFVGKDKPENVRLMRRLSKEDYDTMVGACDVGMLFLDHRFTIPNFPSRMLSYMQAKLPILAVTDPNTDIGRIIMQGEFGWWCESNNSDTFLSIVKECLDNTSNCGNNAYQYLLKHYDVYKTYDIITARWN